MTDSSATKVFSDRARASALAVRRHQQALGASDKPGGAPVAMGGMMVSPAIAARVKQLLAEKAKGKGKKAGKGKGKKVTAPKGTKQEQANQNRASVAKQTGLGDLEGTLVRVGAGMARGGADLEPEKHDALIKKGLAQRHADGSVTLSPAGRKWKSAADKGDADAANAALNDAKAGAADRTAKEQEKASKKAEHEQAKQAKQAERVAAQAKKQAAAQAKLKAAAGKAKAKAGAGGGKSKGKAGAAPAKASTPANNRAKVAKDMAEQDAGLSPSGSAALSDFADGKPLKDDTAKEFASMGLVETGSDGQHRLTSEGRAAAAAMSKGDTRGAIDAISRAADKKKAAGESEKKRGDAQTSHDKAKADASAKRTAADKAKVDAQSKRDASAARVEQSRIEAARSRNRKAIDMSDLDLAIKAGARNAKADKAHLDSAALHLHAAGATCPDCAPGEDVGDEAAGKAIKSIMDDPGYFAQHECNDVMQACSGLQTLAMLIQSELSEDDPDPADINQLTDAARILVKFIDSELDEMESAAEEDVKEDANEPVPMAKAADDAWLHMGGGAIKATDDDAIKGLAVLYATKATHDLEKDYYDKNSDLWLDHWGWPRPITYHHGMDAGTRDDPVVGHWTKATVTDEGVWLEGQLDRAHRYYKAIKELAQRGYLKISSDSGPQWVIREPQTNGANYIKRWPLVSASVTVTPMEPRMFPVEVKAFLAELGYEAINTDNQEAVNPDLARADGLKASDERARALLLELDILQLEETAR